jgi:DNA-binding PucR family transcriptional regulator
MARARDVDSEVQDWVQARVGQILAGEELGDLVQLVDDAVATEVPEIGSDPGLRRVLDASTEDALRIYLARVPFEPPGTTDASPEMQGLGRELAQRGADVSVVLRVYRVGQRTIWQELMDQVAEARLDHDLQAAVLTFLWEHLSRTLEHVVEDVVAAFVGEAEQRIRGSFARRAETIASILRGDDVDADGATLAIGHKLARHQTALVLWGSGDADPAGLTVRLEHLARAIGEAVGATAPLTVPAGGHSLWAWLATPPTVDVDEVARTRDLVEAPDVRVAVGEPAPGVAGFRDSHREAVRAREVASAAGGAGQVTRFRDIEVVDLLAADQEAMRRFAGRALGGLSGRDATTGRLRETLLAYYRAGSSSRAAQELTVHKNTVLYRLQQTEQLLGHPVDEQRFEVEAALRLVTAYGDSVLPE